MEDKLLVKASTKDKKNAVENTVPPESTIKCQAGNDDKKEPREDGKSFIKLFYECENIKYVIVGPSKDHDSAPLEPCLCLKCYEIMYTTEEKMVEHCSQCKPEKGVEVVYHCNKCDFTSKTQFGACLHFLEEGSCGGEVKPVRKTKQVVEIPICETPGVTEKSEQLDYGKWIKKYCKTCETQTITQKRTKDDEKCRKCNNELHHLCMKCKKTFNKYHKAKYHLLSECFTVRYVCHVTGCGVKTKTASSLKNHVKRRHTQIRSYCCKSCDFKTNEHKALRKHLREQHIAHEYFKCDYCPEWCTQTKGSIRQHIIRAHLAKNERKKD